MMILMRILNLTCFSVFDFMIALGVAAILVVVIVIALIAVALRHSSGIYYIMCLKKS